MSIRLLFIVIASLIVQSLFSISMKTGDLLFTGIDAHQASDAFGSAINDVTKVDEKANYTHMGIVEVIGDEVWVLHADAAKGVCRELLCDFLQDRLQASVYRIHSLTQLELEQVVENAHGYLGLPYDSAFILNKKSHYCSGFIYTLFREFQIFKLEPMTFKRPNCDAFLPFWVSYYEQLGLAIPEGYPGCNPNGMALSEGLVRVCILDYFECCT